MTADAFRHLFDYHFRANNRLWTECVLSLNDAQFTEQVDYGIGSIRNHVVHQFNVDDRWFSGLRGEEVPGFVNPVHYYKRDVIQAERERVEAKARDYLAGLTDDMLLAKPFDTPERPDSLTLWQILAHIVNHGTDHRAQMLMLLARHGVTTFPQDYVFFCLGRL